MVELSPSRAVEPTLPTVHPNTRSDGGDGLGGVGGWGIGGIGHRIIGGGWGWRGT